ncbi:hypothetical protein [Tsukamurella sp. NPDC003166]|uniref:hypothetical protein n=1 Tax=Tsukamurella sp. NPDC003166 TaxID=3154444 RepID=UPI0033A77029
MTMPVMSDRLYTFDERCELPEDERLKIEVVERAHPVTQGIRLSSARAAPVAGLLGGGSAAPIGAARRGRSHGEFAGVQVLNVAGHPVRLDLTALTRR